MTATTPLATGWEPETPVHDTLLQPPRDGFDEVLDRIDDVYAGGRGEVLLPARRRPGAVNHRRLQR